MGNADQRLVPRAAGPAGSAKPAGGLSAAQHVLVLVLVLVLVYVRVRVRVRDARARRPRAQASLFDALPDVA
ncbi:hypothetical protein [Sorangium sp. So ce204]|uniref:hypothetical protein n=1 Tax=Sorangium sp. So ce204 TaxID=3133288 RepID=UPI003F626285